MNKSTPSCEGHGDVRQPRYDQATTDSAAELLRALGDPARLRLLALLLDGELCVSELAAAMQDSLPAVSQRLKLLRSQRVVRARRDGKHIYYRLADGHVAELVENCLEYFCEPRLRLAAAEAPARL